jgi:hypothetical protein
MVDIIVKPTLRSTPVTLDAPASVTTVWHPSLTPGVDYIFNLGNNARRRRVRVDFNDNRIHMISGTIDIDVDGGPMIQPAGPGPGIWYIEGVHCTNTNHRRTDAVRATSGAGGDPQTGANGVVLMFKKCRIDGLMGSDNLDPLEVHADGFQFPGGIGEVWLEDVTIESAYVGYQGQREQFVTGSIVNLTAATFDGLNRRADLTFDSPLNLSTTDPEGQWVEITGANPSTWRSTWQVQTILEGSVGSATKVTVDMGTASPETYTGGGLAQQSRFIYYVGSHFWNRVNWRRLDNAVAPAPAQTLSAWRTGGRPDAKGGNAEDRFPGIPDGIGGWWEMHDVWVEPNSGETILDMVEPSSGTNVYDPVEPARTAPDGGAAPYLTWPGPHPKLRDALTHSNVDGTEVRAFEGVPSMAQGAPRDGDFCRADECGIGYPFTAPPSTSSLRVRRRVA